MNTVTVQKTVLLDNNAVSFLAESLDIKKEFEASYIHIHKRGKKRQSISKNNLFK